MLPKEHRLTAQELKNLPQTGARVIHAPLFVAKVFESDRSACAVVVSKKVAPRAVDRNSVRRRVYHLLAAHTLRPASVVIYTKHGINTSSPKELERQLLELLQKSGLIKP